MCGIVGYIGTDKTVSVLLDGLEKLEYRGYDSAGIATLSDEQVNLFKVKGRIQALRDKVGNQGESMIGIGHTRWATHGEPSEENAHPHQSQSGRFTLVHNGVIENYYELRDEYLTDITLTSETDTEIIVQLIEKKYNETNDVLKAFTEVMGMLKGSYAIGLLDKENPDLIYVSKNKSPLLVGLGDDFNLVASDAIATLKQTNTYLEIEDGEIVLVEKEQVRIQKLDGTAVEREPFIVETDAADTEKGTYDYFMMKEIDEQPFVMRKIIQQYQDESNNIKVEQAVRDEMGKADRIYIIAAGTSYNAGLVGKQIIENVAGIPVEVHIASEFSYNMPLLSEKPLFIFISQSGETADSRSVLVQTQAMGHPSITITNVPGSTLSREADYTLPLYAGPEIAVASTKAYTAQIAVLTILAVDTAKAKGKTLTFDPLQELAIVANAMETLTDQKEVFEQMALDLFKDTRNAFYIGRGVDYYVVQEASLKLKEISYIQAEGFAGGELKHGTIALIEEGTPVIAIATQENVNLSIRGNVQEVAARGANTCTVSMEGLEKDEDRVVLPHVHPLLTPLVSVVPMQLLAYYAAVQRGCDVDKPRNLAKSVTVE
ncbi:glutamine--fructose-6-phosphate aminotransferase [isomerizing] [Halolactibacillus miurensis]|uniref:Glutamine--fructose-6-phosphate aminotransferase [isomerizing] n=1 Tax=Halolactibacillus miurensis TaxID=306541 RepID=A0A1I6URZ9_9BACI|nr:MULTISPECIES: glutamine--fructose-6-phosphate transaminase (isomerizing) [Halolactibacillus]GEM05512.1 glutamine--fructose-6-phosphate aminotransferase [isomerizing] [Halolactibacillus miurensis]SFT04238.1 glucosamine--fructose-6-phosphate aminotransferase (isomerizing) [Halolactibacillus miurensis]